MRVIGLDIHRTFAQVAVLEHGTIHDRGRFAMEREAVLQFAGTALRPDDEVVLEATVNTAAVARLLAPFVKRVAVANPMQVRAIAHAKVKTDRIDAAVLAKLHSSGFLPEVWMPSPEIEAQRRQVAERAQLVNQITRLKNRTESVLHANLVPRELGRLYTKKGRAQLDAMGLPEDQKRQVLRHLAEIDRLGVELAAVDKALAVRALSDPQVCRLMTIGGVGSVVAASVLAAVGEISRFDSPQQLVSYLGLNPSVHQSGGRPAFHGHITKQGRSHARSMLVEAAWTMRSTPGPLRAFFQRIASKRGEQVAAVATARKLAVLMWHLLTKQQDYAFARPALLALKQRRLELQAGAASRRGGNKPGPARDYSVRSLREQERARVEVAESQYRQFVRAWKPQRESETTPT